MFGSDNRCGFLLIGTAEGGIRIHCGSCREGQGGRHRMAENVDVVVDECLIDAGLDPEDPAAAARVEVHECVEDPGIG